MSVPPASKVLSRAKLLEWRAQMRSAGRTVVHCHGCFDIVHPGHIAHLQEARSLGDVLLVSVSSDANVNKGHARPLIPDDLRAASLAALECVDAVFVNTNPTAVELLGSVRPDVFVKGREYERSVDPRFLAEQQAVKAGGGKVAFTSGEIVYSSTALIAQLTQTDPFEREKLARFRNNYDLSPRELHRLVRGMEGKRVVVVGDYICDRYHFCDATGIASEGPMMALRLLGRKDYDGGAAVIARHAAALGADVTLITSLSDDAEGHHVRDRLTDAGVRVGGLTHRKQLVTKHRYLCETTKVLKVDEGPVVPTDSADVETLADAMFAATQPQRGRPEPRADAVIFVDFGFGMLSPPVLSRLLPIARERATIVSADISGRRGSLLQFKDIDLLTPTEREIREATGDFGAGLNAVAWNLMHQTHARGLLVTLGRQGVVSFDLAPGEQPGGRLRSEHVPALARHSVDPLGCGDALLTVATLTRAAGGSLQAAALLGSAAAAVQVARLGNDAITTDDLLTQLTALDPAAPPLHSPHPPIRLAS